jgi:excisionase family DNA binding protein
VTAALERPALNREGLASAMVQTARAATAEHPLLTVEEVAELLRVPPSWVYERTRSRAANRIPGFRLGKYWRFREADVFDWLERQRSGVRANA